MNPFAIIHGIAGLIIAAVAVPLIKRKVRRNMWYGVKIPEAFKSEERWLEINEYGGRLILRLGIVVCAAAGIGLLLPELYWLVYAWTVLVVILGGLGLVLTLTVRYAAKTRKK